MELYNKIARLCAIKGYFPSGMCDELGIARNFISDLKAGRKQTISVKNAKKIADFLNVPIWELLGEEYQTQPQVTEQEQMLQDIKDNPDLQILFSMTRNASKEDIRKVIDIFKIMKGE